MKLLITTMCLLLLSACGGADIGMPTPQHLKLLPPAEGPAPVLLKQAVTVEAAGTRRQFLMVVRIERDQVSLVALSATGQKILSVNYDGVEFDQQQQTPEVIPAREILALMQFVRWPQQSIKKHYSKAEGWLSEMDLQHRVLLTNQGVSVRVEFRKNEIIVDNIKRRYRVFIQLLDSVDLST